MHAFTNIIAYIATQTYVHVSYDMHSLSIIFCFTFTSCSFSIMVYFFMLFYLLFNAYKVGLDYSWTCPSLRASYPSLCSLPSPASSPSPSPAPSSRFSAWLSRPSLPTSTLVALRRSRTGHRDPLHQEGLVLREEGPLHALDLRLDRGQRAHGPGVAVALDHEEICFAFRARSRIPDILNKLLSMARFLYLITEVQSMNNNIIPRYVVRTLTLVMYAFHITLS